MLEVLSLSVFILCALIGFLFLLSIVFAPCAKADAVVDLQWTAPTTNCDFTTLNDLAGYHVKWGFTPGVYTVELDVGNVTATPITLIGDVEVRYDPEKKRVVYEPVSIEPRTLVPRVIRHDERYTDDESSDA